MRATPSYPQISTRCHALTRNGRVRLRQIFSLSSSKTQPVYLSARRATSAQSVANLPHTLIDRRGKQQTPQNSDNSSSVQ